MDEQTKALIDNAKAEAEQAFSEQLKEAKSTQDKLVEELKEERRKKQEKEAEAEALRIKYEKSNPGATDVDIDKKVEEVLSKKEQAQAEVLKDNTIKKFKETNPEFHPDNDKGGIKYAAFEKKLARINLNGLTSENDILGALDDAMLLLKRELKDDSSNYNPYASTSQQAPSPRTVSNKNLSTVEQNLIKQVGWTEEKYIKMKTARPSYVASLLKNFN